MALLAVIALASLAVLGVLVYLGFLAGRFFHLARFPDEIHFATTSDGWRIAVCRYRPRGVEGGEPVLLVHGLAANRLNLDLSEDRSAARALADSGRDVWIVALRGRGLSTRPRLFSPVRYDWSFDDYVERDLPAAAACVLQRSGARRLHLVGFSTGALACYAWLSAPGRTIEVGSLCAIGGPASFRRASRALSGRLIRALRFLRHRWLLRMLAPISGFMHPLSLFYNPENIEAPLLRRAMVNMVVNFSRNELLQYSDWILNDTFRSIDHRRDYRADLGRITVPALLLAGPRDPLAPPDAVKDAFDALGSTDKQFQICSRAQGLEHNYGHFDLVVGTGAPVEIYPRLAAFIAAHTTSAPMRSVATIQ